MGTYLISDIHGDSAHFLRLLERVHIDFSKDRLYILGDVLDRGEHSLRLLMKIRKWMDYYGDSVILLKGNHEKFCEMYLKNQLSERLWTAYGGGDTVKEIKALTEPEKKDLLHFLENLPLYKEIQSPVYGKMVLTHAGLLANLVIRNSDDSVNVARMVENSFEADEYRALLSVDVHDMPIVQFDRMVVVGHVPTINLEGHSYKMLRRNKLFCIDSGAGHRSEGGRLLLYCVDDDREYYA